MGWKVFNSTSIDNKLDRNLTYEDKSGTFLKVFNKIVINYEKTVTFFCKLKQNC